MYFEQFDQLLLQFESAGFRVFNVGYNFETWYEPGCRTFAILINGFCIYCKIVKAPELLNAMVEKGYWPDVVTYGTIVNVLCKTGAVIGMHRKMEGGGCKPDRVVYSVTIDHICMDGLLIEGLSLLLK